MFGRGSAQFVTDVEGCAEQAPAAAGDRVNRPRFDGGLLGPGHIEPELVRRLEARDVTHLRYRVRHRMAPSQRDANNVWARP
jgi:hypothetical protein